MNFSSIWLVLFLPLAGSVVQALLGGMVVKALGPRQGKRVMGAIATLAIGGAFAVGALLTQKLAGIEASERSHVETLFQWIHLPNLSIPFEALIDPLSMTMVLIITGIGCLIHLYATAYMAEDKEYTRFFTYLNLFVAAMLVLVLGNNLALMFIGWEGVGLCSYLLIGFWYKDISNAKSANKAFIVNRIGDWGLTLGVFLLTILMTSNLDKSQDFGNRWLSYDVILKAGLHVFEVQPFWTTVAALLLFVGACGKSAQFPLYLWLPDAMAGPTPVSALIHAATMVTAGVFLLNRMNLIYQMSSTASAVVCAVGAFTALFAALIAFGQTDIKKVLAYSTVSQLGFMFVGCGAGAYWTGMFHVTTHAFFKALLFLGSGAVIYAMSHEQDMRRYGGLRKYLPITFGAMMMGYLALAGVSLPKVFGFAGYYSKESIIAAAMANDHGSIPNFGVSYVAGWVALIVACLTAMYMTRLMWLTFFGKERWPEMEETHDDHGQDHEHAHAHHSAHDHGPDVHSFFYTDEQMTASHDEHEHHHALDKDHKPKEVPISMWLPLVLLAVPSVVGGWYLERNELFMEWLYPELGPEGHGLPLLGKPNLHLEPGHLTPFPEAVNPIFGSELAMLSFFAAIGGILLAWLFLRLAGKGKLPASEGWDLSKWSSFKIGALNQFGYDSLMVNASVEGGGLLATTLWKRFDVGVVDFLVNATGEAARKVGAIFRTIQSGYARTYALVMLIGAAILLLLLTQQTGHLGVLPSTATKTKAEAESR